MEFKRLNQVLGGSKDDNNYFIINHYKINERGIASKIETMLSYLRSKYFTCDSQPDWINNNIDTGVIPFPLNTSLLTYEDIRLERGNFCQNIINLFKKYEEGWESYQEYFNDLKSNLFSINEYIKNYEVQKFYYFIDIDDWNPKSNKIVDFYKELGTNHLPFIEHFYFGYLPLISEEEFIIIQIAFE